MPVFLPASPFSGLDLEGATEAPHYSPRDHARLLGLSEAELIEMDEGATSLRLRPNWPSLLAALRTLGPTVVRSCNENAAIETACIYPLLRGDGATCRSTGRDIDLRLFLARWAHVWAVTQEGQTCLQVFGRDGAAIHKVSMTRAANRAAWMQVLEAYAAPGLPAPEIVPEPDAPAVLPMGTTDLAAFRVGWDRLHGGNDFANLLDGFAVAHLQALHLAGPGRARPVPADSLPAVLEAVRTAELPIETLVGNPGCLHAVKGRVSSLQVTPGWLEAYNPRFTLRLRRTGIAEAWVVSRPTEYGVSAAVEVFDRAGGMIARLSGHHGADLAEERRWRAILDALPP